MRKWMRDRIKRRKKPGTNPESNSGQDSPAPLQPTFLDRADNAVASQPGSEVAGGMEQDAGADEPRPIYEAQPEVDSDDADSAPSEVGGEAKPPRGKARDRSRRRGRRGRGSKGAPVDQSNNPVLPIPPGKATGEAAEVALDGSTPPETPVQPKPRRTNAAKPKKAKGAVVLAIGLPGSGKSSWFKRHSIIPLSSDLIRGLLFDDATEQRFQDLVFSTLRAMLRARMLAARPWNYIDATNLSPKERHSWIKMAQDFGYEAHAVYFDVPTEICMERNQRRSRNVPEDVMQRMAQKLRPPTFEEGFAKITVVRLKRSEAPAEPVSGNVDSELEEE